MCRAFFVFSGSSALALVPSSPTREHAHVGMFFVLGCLPTLSCTLTPPQDTKNTRVSRVFCVRRLSYPSPRPQHENRALVGMIFVLGPFPCSPTHRTCPHGHVLRAGLPPRPLLHSHPPQDTKNTRVSRVFRFRRLSYPTPPSQPENHSLVGPF